MTILVDPVLPEGFDSTPNEQRTRRELDAWWNRPYALSRPDGGYDVRCLDGGAWDRPTYYGTAPDLEAAELLAEAKLGQWLETRSRPTVLVESSKVLVILMPQRPDLEPTVLYQTEKMEDAARWIEANRARPT